MEEASVFLIQTWLTASVFKKNSEKVTKVIPLKIAQYNKIRLSSIKICIRP
jgi:hypothetical protein